MVVSTGIGLPPRAGGWADSDLAERLAPCLATAVVGQRIAGLTAEGQDPVEARPGAELDEARIRLRGQPRDEGERAVQDLPAAVLVEDLQPPVVADSQHPEQIALLGARLEAGSAAGMLDHDAGAAAVPPGAS